MLREWNDRGLDLEPVAAAPASAEIEALEAGSLLVPLPDTGVLTLRGSDRIDFLHGQISNDVRGLRSGETNRSLLLNHRGHALADMRVLRQDAELQVAVDGGGLEVVEESLRRHIIFDQVELERRAHVGVLSLQGPAAAAEVEEVLGAEVPAEGRFQEAESGGEAVTVWRARRSPAGGVDLLAGEATLQRLAAALLASGAVPGSRPALELARVLATLPAARSEGGDGILPQEAGLEPLVSYRKGCYLGQEIMARIEARGKLRRQLAALSLASLPPAGERDVRSDGKLVGRLGQVALHPERGYLALAVLRNDLAEDATLEVGGVACQVAPTPAPATGG